MQIEVLLSIKPKFAASIFSGNKKFEFRKAIFRNARVKKVYVYAGRESTGYSLIYFGGIRMVSVSQPPNIKITLQTFTGELQKVETSIRSGGELIRLSVLSQQIASGLGLNLIFEASDRNIGSYSYSGSKLKEVEKLNELININAYIASIST